MELENLKPGEVYVVRVGDQDEYHIAKDLYTLVEEHLAHIKTPLTYYHQYGVECEEYKGRYNYISLFVGTDIETPIRDVTQAGLDALNLLIQKG